MAMIAHKCASHLMTVVDINQQRIDAWNLMSSWSTSRGSTTSFGRREERICSFPPTLMVRFARQEMDLYLGQHTDENLRSRGACCRSALHREVCAQGLEVADGDKIVVEKSTLPGPDGEFDQAYFETNADGRKFQIYTNPSSCGKDGYRGPRRTRSRPDRGEQSAEGKPRFSNSSRSTRHGCHGIDSYRERLVIGTVEAYGNGFRAAHFFDQCDLCFYARQPKRMWTRSRIRSEQIAESARNFSSHPSASVGLVFRKTFSIWSIFVSTLACRRLPSIGTGSLR